jgi:hypothetical protein
MWKSPANPVAARVASPQPTCGRIIRGGVVFHRDIRRQLSPQVLPVEYTGGCGENFERIKNREYREGGHALFLGTRASRYHARLCRKIMREQAKPRGDLKQCHPEQAALAAQSKDLHLRSQFPRYSSSLPARRKFDGTGGSCNFQCRFFDRLRMTRFLLSVRVCLVPRSILATL